MIPISIVLVDSNIVFRNKLASILEAASFKLLAQINHTEVEKQFEESVPDLAILCYKSSKPATLKQARFINDNFPNVKLIIYSMFPTTLPEEIKVDRVLSQTMDDLSTLDRIILELFQQNKQ